MKRYDAWELLFRSNFFTGFQKDGVHEIIRLQQLVEPSTPRQYCGEFRSVSPITSLPYHVVVELPACKKISLTVSSFSSSTKERKLRCFLMWDISSSCQTLWLELTIWFRPTSSTGFTDIESILSWPVETPPPSSLTRWLPWYTLPAFFMRP